MVLDVIAVRQLFDLPASQSSKFLVTVHVCEERPGRWWPQTSQRRVRSSPASYQARRRLLVHRLASQQCLALQTLVFCVLHVLLSYHWTSPALLLAYCRDRFDLLVENLPAALCEVCYVFTGTDCSR